MKYIVHSEFNGGAICGDVILPAGTVCDCDGVIISHKGKPICFVKSENAHQFFAVNDDNMGMERGRLTQAIQRTLSTRDSRYQERWDKVWGDTVCKSYKRADYADFWLWGHSFFTADISTLEYIAKLVGAEEGE